ncbi:MAG: UDP-N-acetylmuramoyl-L-alanyl-D-glutamate--2,6-diaminopimelate ligase [Planctomycetota bacterium]
MCCVAALITALNRPHMNLLDLTESLGLKVVSGDGGVEISDLTDDSRRVGAGFLFVARGEGSGDERWRGFVADAVTRGASAVVAPVAVDVPDGVALAVPEQADTPIDQPFAGRLAAEFFGHPAKRLKLIGVTGTNGKTTVATLTQYLLNAAGTKTGLLGTIAIDHGSPNGPLTAELTTPGAIDLHRHFAAMVAQGCEACAMEVSSHALDQGRVDGLEFDVAVFTNITQDHLDYHGTMENYAAAKAKLFKSLDHERDAVAVLNADDPSWHKMVPSWKVMKFFTRLQPDPEKGIPGGIRAEYFSARIESLAVSHSTVNLSGPMARDSGGIKVKLPVVGQHSVSNVLQAVAAAYAVKTCPADQLATNLFNCPQVPGRLEVVRAKTLKVPTVLVDYAHTPDALSNVLRALNSLVKDSGRFIVVFGCGGDRDRTKRPLMAQAACGLADITVLTSDNPRTEDPQQILDDAIAGVPTEAKHKLIVEIDRAKAIESAILNASADDTVLIAGKGHEDYQILGTEKIHFDDREHAAAALEKWVAQHGGDAA